MTRYKIILIISNFLLSFKTVLEKSFFIQQVGKGLSGNKPRAASVFSSKSSVSGYRPPVGVPATSPITSPDTARTYLYQGLIGKLVLT